MTTVKDFQNIQTKYKDKYKQRLQRQYKIGIGSFKAENNENSQTLADLSPLTLNHC